MIRAKNYETVTKFVKVMSRILWPLFPQTRCRLSAYIEIMIAYMYTSAGNCGPRAKLGACAPGPSLKPLKWP